MANIVTFSIILLWVIVIFNLILTVGLIRRTNNISYENRNIENGLKIGEPAPFFEAQTLKNEPVNLSLVEGESTVLIFISVNCAPCVEKIPKFNSLINGAAKQAVRLLLVSSDSKEEIEKFSEAQKLDLPIVFAQDGDASLFEKFKIFGTPSYCFIDDANRVVATGYLDEKWDELTSKWSVD